MLPDAQHAADIFVNQLGGEMGFVGPRPLPEAYLSRYSTRQSQRLHVRPGVTGWAQINGRNAVSWDERLEMDDRLMVAGPQPDIAKLATQVRPATRI